MNKSGKDSKNSYKPVTKVEKGHKELLKQIGDELDKIREEKNISVRILCEKANISRTTYYRIKDGLIYFNIKKLLDLLDKLDANVTIKFKDNNTTEQA